LIHRARNILAKVPVHAQAKGKAEYWAIWDGIEAAPGEAPVAEATRRAKTIEAKWAQLYPAAVACLEEDFADLTTYLRFPAEHWGRIRHSNIRHSNEKGGDGIGKQCRNRHRSRVR
jgi:transposase-like protein